MQHTRQQVLPDPWMDRMVHDSINSAAAVLWAVGAWGGSDLAMYVPQVFPARCTPYELRFHAGNTSGNYDLGVYDSQFRLIASKGSTAMSAAIQTLTLSNFTVEAGSLYYAALAMSDAAGTILRVNYTPSYPAQAAGIATEAAALPLPATATPVAAARALVPVFAWGIR